MSEQRATEPGQPSLTPPDQTLLPPSAAEGFTPPPARMPAPPPPPTSMWNRIAAFIVLIAVVAAAAGAGIGWTLARAVNGHQVAQSTARTVNQKSTIHTAPERTTSVRRVLPAAPRAPADLLTERVPSPSGSRGRS